jgi:hypothetical protein
VLPWTLGAFAVAMLSGLTMFTAHAADYLTNGCSCSRWG